MKQTWHGKNKDPKMIFLDLKFNLCDKPETKALIVFQAMEVEAYQWKPKSGGIWASTVPSPEHLWNHRIVVWKGFPVCDKSFAADVTVFLKSGKVVICVIQ